MDTSADHGIPSAPAQTPRIRGKAVPPLDVDYVGRTLRRLDNLLLHHVSSGDLPDNGNPALSGILRDSPKEDEESGDESPMGTSEREALLVHALERNGGGEPSVLQQVRDTADRFRSLSARLPHRTPRATDQALTWRGVGKGNLSARQNTNRYRRFSMGDNPVWTPTPRYAQNQGYGPRPSIRGYTRYQMHPP